MYENGYPPQSHAPDTTVEINEAENAKTLARIMAASNKTPGDAPPSNPLNPLEKYTEGPMPDVADGNPATLLTGLDQVQIQSWLALSTGKVLARPFDTDVNYQPNHQSIAKDLLAAAKEITGAQTGAVATPNKDKGVPAGRRHLRPKTFLIHDLTRKEVESLLERKIWSSKEITFQVAPINVRRPEFLFTLIGFITDTEDHVIETVTSIWNDPVTCTILRNLAYRVPDEEEQQERLNQMMEFLESAAITKLDVRSTGGRPDPHFNVYADGEIIESDELWLELRNYLRSRTYRSALYGTGRVKQENFICSLCHGHDHPRGLCPFPHIQGWNGGGRIPKRIANAAARGGNWNQADMHTSGNRTPSTNLRGLPPRRNY